MNEEIQAIVLAAGHGMRMNTLTHTTAKCFLPIGTYPMIYYPLYKLQEAGFTGKFLYICSRGILKFFI